MSRRLPRSISGSCSVKRAALCLPDFRAARVLVGMLLCVVCGGVGVLVGYGVLLRGKKTRNYAVFFLRRSLLPPVSMPLSTPFYLTNRALRLCRTASTMRMMNELDNQLKNSWSSRRVWGVGVAYGCGAWVWRVGVGVA